MTLRMAILPLVCVAGLLLLATPPAAGQEATTETPGLDTRAMVEHLAADALEGRMTGSAGIRMAADYIVEQFDAIGAVPLSALGSFRQPFRYTAGVIDAGTTLRLEGEDSLLTVSSTGESPATSDDGPAVRAVAGHVGRRPGGAGAGVLGVGDGGGPAGLRGLRADGAGDRRLRL